MASYGALIRMITTAEINRVQRDGGYTRWAYFVDMDAGKAGMIFANDDIFAAYSVPDDPDPKLTEFGLEHIRELVLTPDPELLVLDAGSNELRALVFTTPAAILEDDLAPGFDPSAAHDWQQFLHSRSVRMAEDPRHRRAKRLALGAIAALTAFFAYLALFG